MEERQRHRHRVWPSPQRACCRSCDGEGRPWQNNSQNPDESKTSEAGQLWRWSSLPFAWLPPPSSSSSPSPFSPPPYMAPLQSERSATCASLWPGGMIWHSYVALRLVMFVQRANGDVPCGHLLPFCFVPSVHLPSLLAPLTHMALVQSERQCHMWLYVAKSMWVLFGLFFMLSNFYQIYLHNKTFIALASL